MSPETKPNLFFEFQGKTDLGVQAYLLRSYFFLKADVQKTGFELREKWIEMQGQRAGLRLHRRWKKARRFNLEFLQCLRQEREEIEGYLKTIAWDGEQMADGFHQLGSGFGQLIWLFILGFNELGAAAGRRMRKTAVWAGQKIAARRETKKRNRKQEK